MKGKRYSNEQIIYALKRVESGDKANEVCRQLGVNEATFYLWKKKYGGMGVTELGRLKQLEDENQRLKKLVADLSLDKHILQEVLAKKV
jgi:putative transposase